MRRSLFTLLVLACSSWAHADEALPDVFARFEIRNGARVEHLELVRRGDRIEHRYLERGYSELWSRSARGELEHVRAFPRAGKLVHYTHGDLRTIGLEPDWSALSSLVSKREQSSLAKAGRDAKSLGHTASSLRGNVQGQAVRIAWLDDVSLPARVSYDDGRTISLTAIDECTEALCAAPVLDTMRSIEFADLGDMEYDPFVRTYLAHAMGHTHR